MTDLVVYGLATYPYEAASTRYRLCQLIEPLRLHGIDLRVHPFLSSATYAALYDRRKALRTAGGIMMGLLRRLVQLPSLVRADAILVQREAMLVGPGLYEWLAIRALRKPMVLDLDDATYISQKSLVYGRLATLLKWPSKTDELIALASEVVCGSPAVAEYARKGGARTRVVPTVVDTDLFAPRPEESRSPHPVVGWIGSPSAFPYLERILPLLEELGRRRRFRLLIVGSGVDSLPATELDVDLRPWKLDREVSDFQEIDIGLYPLSNDAWAAGKSGLKALQYLSVGAPYVASPVGIVHEIGIPGVTHFSASSDEEWLDALERLLTSTELRKQMGAAGRSHVVEHYSLNWYASEVADAIRGAVGGKREAKGAANRDDDKE